MESYIKVKATQKEMNEIFDNTESGFLIKLVDIIEEGQENDLYKVVVRHGDYIGEQDGKTFTYDQFMETFENGYFKERNKRKIEELKKESDEKYKSDIDMAKKGIEGGLTAKAVAKVLKIYGSSNCKEDKYIKNLIKTEEIQSLIQKNKKIMEMAR